MCKNLEFKTAVILAGGKSSRMGFDKQFMKVNEIRLLESLINKLRKEFEDIVIISNKPEFYQNFNVRVYEDEIKGIGPLAGLYKGLKEAKGDFVYFIACDMPNINLKYIEYMKNIIQKSNVDNDACVTRYEKHIEPFNAFYSRKNIKRLKEHIELKRGWSIYSYTKQIKVLYIEEQKARLFSPGWDMFFNLNTKEDIQRYIESLEEAK